MFVRLYVADWPHVSWLLQRPLHGEIGAFYKQGRKVHTVCMLCRQNDKMRAFLTETGLLSLRYSEIMGKGKDIARNRALKLY